VLIDNTTVYVAIVLATLLAAAATFAGARLVDSFKNRALAWATISALGLYLLLLFLQPHSLLVSDLSVLLVPLLLGAVLGRRIATPQALVSFVVAAAIVDFLSFSDGLTASIIEGYRSGENLFLQYLALSIPLRGDAVPVVGIGDLIILSTVFTAFKRMDVGGLLSFVAPAGGLMVALILGLIGGGIYALPFIAAGVTAYLLLTLRRTSQTPPGPPSRG
jgi:hypothetical protein